MSRVLLTGGCGYLGSHQAVSLLSGGDEVVVVDDLSNSDRGVLEVIEALSGRSPMFHRLDVRDTEALTALMADTRPDAVIHFAGLKHVAESVSRPLDYHTVNVGGLLSLLQAGSATGVTRLVFSSSGSVYGAVECLPIAEHTPAAPTNPYSASKAMCERILQDVCAADDRWSVVSLRYFNPAGAHPSGLMGEAPTQLLSNLVPVLMDAAWWDRRVAVNGQDYPTADGTAVRDYVHVMDVAEAHRRALIQLPDLGPGFSGLNIGRGRGTSVLELVDAARRVTGAELPIEYGPRRPGDVAALVADTARARDVLGEWRLRSLDEIMADAWRWQQRWQSGRARLVSGVETGAG
jgi:UDP-glucose 4-epimerase